VKKGLLSQTKRKNYLFVEGADDREVFIHLLNHHGITSRDLSQRGRFKEKDESYIHTWLSWQKEPGTPMGHAITKEYMNANAPHALQLITWFRNVFEFSFPES